MARNNFMVSTGEVATTGNATKTLLTVIAPSNISVAIKSASIFFDSSNPSQENVIVELVRFTGADGTGTTVTPTKKFTGSNTIQSTSKKSYSAEPSTPEILIGMEINAQAGVVYNFPLDGELVIKGGEILGVRYTTPSSGSVNPNAYVNMECEE
jgi:hypothetical protein